MTAPEPRAIPARAAGTDALARARETDRLRLELAVDAAGIGSFDWDLVTGRLSWDQRLLEIFGYDREGWRAEVEGIGEYLASYGERMPAALSAEHKRIQELLAKN